MYHDAQPWVKEDPVKKNVVRKYAVVKNLSRKWLGRGSDRAESEGDANGPEKTG